MRKRLRKKLRLGEFQELMFALRLRLAPMGLKELDAFLETFLTECMEANGLGFNGSWGEEAEGFVMHLGRGPLTEENRDQVVTWFRGRGEVVEVEAGPLVDAWYGPEEGRSDLESGRGGPGRTGDGPITVP
ncbi:MAG: DUF469 family protein [Candidatus Tectomicrobia bacterium]|uniref:DUF469 family protein n=1 Tax=Tectimicrobiota bacterium TaxID=2528274 RepID=A0A932CNZ4_UNCTE|nr:DUF469 family protein [Candidatus Tectomicrobia bacterium]